MPNTLIESLRTSLADYQPTTALEISYIARMSALLHTDTSTRRDNYSPGHFTASAFLLSPDGTQIALIFHGKLHLWLQPGGHIEPTDVSLPAAAAREVREETGNHDFTLINPENPIFDIDIHLIPEHKRTSTPKHDHFDVRVLFQASSMTLTAGDDAVDARWVGLDDVKDAGTDQSVLRAVGKLKSRLVG